MLATAGGRAEARVGATVGKRGTAERASSYHSRIPRRRRIFSRERPAADRVLQIIGGAVIVLILAAAIATAFTISNFLGVLGLLLLVLVAGVLFSRRFG